MAITAVDDIHSNAYNFLSCITAGVDPRTGMYTCSVAFSQLLANDLAGPAVPLVLAYNPMQTRNVGFGKGWSLQLSSYNRASQRLQLSSGDSYKADKSPTALSVRDQKLKSFRVLVEASGDLRVEHKSGLVEILSNPGTIYDEWLPSAIHSPEGRSITLIHKLWGGNRYLSEVNDSNGLRLLEIIPAETLTTLTLWPDDPAKRLDVRLILGGSELSRIELAIGAPRPAWRIQYATHTGLRVITRMESPAGGAEVIQYHANGIPLPSGAPATHLPCVAQHLHYPGQGQPVLTRDFNFAVESSHNYLGWGASLTWSNDGDNLYKVLSDYRYSSTEILVTGTGASKKELRRVLRTYNRFHLLVLEQTRQGGKVKTQTIDYHEEPGKSFPDQPAQCQLPKRAEVAYREEPGGERLEVTLTDFDEYGNPTRTVSPSGAIETHVYYPVEGEAGLCPPDPLAFVRSIKSTTQTPAPGYATAPVLSSHYQYAVLPSLLAAGKGFVVVTQEQVREGATVLTVADKVYANDTSNPFLHGRLLSDSLTINGFQSATSLTYEKLAGQLKTTTRVTGHDGAFSEGAESVDVLTGLPTESRSDSGVLIRSSHDSLGRILSETVAPDTPEQAVKTYVYTLAAASDDGVQTQATDATGARKITLFDGLGREVLISREDVDSEPAVMREVYRATYDVLGQLIEEQAIDWFGAVAVPLVSQHAYDDWGNRSQTTGPDGVVTHTEDDPVSLTRTQWVAGAGKTVTRNNLLGKPDEVIRQDRNGVVNGTTAYVYDGLGRCLQQTDALNQVTRYGYDFANRLLQTTLADGTLITRTYARHSTDDLPTRIEVNAADLQYPLAYLAGEQTFDGLGRLASLTVGGRTQTWSYLPGQSRPVSETTPSGASIAFDYTPALNNQMTRRTVLNRPDCSASYRYSAVLAQMLQADNADDSAYSQAFEYFPSGKLKRETWPNGEPPMSARYTYSLEGLPRSYTDVFDAEQLTEYDALCRVSAVTNGTVQTAFTYNPLGQTAQIVTQDSATGRSLTTTLEYDDFGRETQRTLAFSGETAQVLTQRFDLNDKLLQRTLKTAQVLRDETYEYDTRGRLRVYSCSGPQAPVDAVGNSLVSQTFEFDALDNIRKLTSVFRNPSGGANQTDIALYRFDYPDKTQLSRVEHSHAAYAALNVDLHYNADGHQIDDEQGRVLDYDPLGRLTSVSTAGARQ